jgi:hypothetical protein
MRKLFFAVATAAALVTSSSLMSGQAAAAGPSHAIRAAVDDLNMMENAQYIVEGRQHCWYRNGWHGPGWYWCGYAMRRGLGWGGGEGWQGWRHDERREYRREERRERRF